MGLIQIGTICSQASGLCFCLSRKGIGIYCGLKMSQIINCLVMVLCLLLIKESCFYLQTDELLNYTTEITDLLGKLESCEYSYKVFKGILDSVQKVIDDLNLHAFTNLTKWVKELDEKVSYFKPGNISDILILANFYDC